MPLESSPTPFPQPVLGPLAPPSVPPSPAAGAFDTKDEQERQARAVYTSMEQMHASIAHLK